MAAVGAARLDVTWDRGADWWVRIGRRTRNDVVLKLTSPAVLEVRAVDAPSTTPPLATGTVTVLNEGEFLDIVLPRAAIEALPGEHAQYRCLARDLTSSRDLVLVHGYAKIRDRAGDY